MEEIVDKAKIPDILQELLDREESTVLKTVLVDLHPADIAEAVQILSSEKRRQLFEQLDMEQAGEVLIELDPAVRGDLLRDLSQEHIVAIVVEMDSDDATDVIGELDPVAAKEVLNALPWGVFKEIQTLLRHDEETAGGIMALEIVAVVEDQTVKEALRVLRHKAEEVDDVYNVYVVDRWGVFKGLVTLKELVLASPKSVISTIMNKDADPIHPEMDQEEVANLFHKYDLVAAPVVDEEGRLVGRITVDDVLEVVQEEASEDMTLMAGITDERIRDRSVIRISGVRLPWLLVAFVGEMLSAYVLSRFNASIRQIVASAFFIPLIMAMGGNTGIQSATVVIRGLATGEFSLRDTWRRVLREIAVALLNGLLISLILLLVVTFWQNDVRFGLVLALSMMAVLFNAALIGTVIPFFLKRIGIDPAIATGPFITTTNDVLGLLVYFGMMSVFFHWL